MLLRPPPHAQRVAVTTRGVALLPLKATRAPSTLTTTTTAATTALRPRCGLPHAGRRASSLVVASAPAAAAQEVRALSGKGSERAKSPGLVAAKRRTYQQKFKPSKKRIGRDKKKNPTSPLSFFAKNSSHRPSRAPTRTTTSPTRGSSTSCGPSRRSRTRTWAGTSSRAASSRSSRSLRGERRAPAAAAATEKTPRRRSRSRSSCS